MTKELLVVGKKTFKINVPDDAKITFGPWSPGTMDKYGNSEKALNGTLRVYDGKTEKSSILAVFSGVTSFRDTSIDYEEEVAREEGAILWKSDRDGYKREEKVSRATDWVKAQIGPGTPGGVEEGEDETDL